MARASGKAHVDCEGHTQYVTLMSAEIERQAEWYAEAEERWNTHSRWDALNNEDKRRLAVAVAKDEAMESAKTPDYSPDRHAFRAYRGEQPVSGYGRDIQRWLDADVKMWECWQSACAWTDGQRKRQALKMTEPADAWEAYCQEHEDEFEKAAQAVFAMAKSLADDSGKCEMIDKDGCTVIITVTQPKKREQNAEGTIK